MIKRWLVVLCGLCVASCTLGTSPRTIVGTQVEGFGTNPANLKMYEYVPAVLPPSPAMVVALHHCFQTAHDYVEETGWRMLADRYGFVLLMPEQVVGNDVNLCFDFFSADQERDAFQVQSIRQMIEKAATDHNVDRTRIFATGLSSGAGMAMVMLAAYPEVFAGGGVIGNFPFRCARAVFEVFYCMTFGKTRDAQEWGDLVRAETSHEYRGPWPTLSVWHGDLDLIANPVNAQEVIKQWTNLHATDAEPDREDTVEGFPHYTYDDASGRAVVEFYELIDAGHATPVDPSRGCGDARHGFGDFIYDYGICSSFYIARFWGLTGSDTTWPPPDFVIPATAGEADVVPEEEEQTTPAEEAAPAPEVAPPSEVEAMPAEEDAASETEEETPPSDVQTMPAQEDTAPEPQEAPATDAGQEDAMPLVDAPASEVEPVNEEAAPAEVETAPEAEETPPTGVEKADEEAPPAEEDSAPAIDEWPLWIMREPGQDAPADDVSANEPTPPAEGVPLELTQ